MTKKQSNSAGKGMSPKKGYNQSNWNKNWDFIDWGRGSVRPEYTWNDPLNPLPNPEISESFSKWTFPNIKKDNTNERTNRRTEEISGSNG